MDNGGGMTPDTLHKMLGFGHSDKKEIDGHRYASRLYHNPSSALYQASMDGRSMTLMILLVLMQAYWQVREWVRLNLHILLCVQSIIMLFGSIWLLPRQSLSTSRPPLYTATLHAAQLAIAHLGALSMCTLPNSFTMSQQ